MTLFYRMSLTQPLTDRRDYGASKEDKQFSLHLECMKALSDMAETLGSVADAIEEDEFEEILDKATELEGIVSKFVTDLKSSPVLKPEEFKVGEGEGEEEIPPTERYEKYEDLEGPATLRSHYTFWLNFPWIDR